jgi:hypothetical protein
MATKTDWEELVYTRAESDVLREIMAAFDRGDVVDGNAGLEELLDAMSGREDHQLESRLIVLMAHILKWHTQPPTRSWASTIRTQRRALARLRRRAPRYTQERILRDFWEEVLKEAIADATDEMGQPPAVDTLTWEEVFETEYTLPAAQ